MGMDEISNLVYRLQYAYSFSKSRKGVFSVQGAWHSPNTYPLWSTVMIPYCNLTTANLRGQIIQWQKEIKEQKENVLPESIRRISKTGQTTEPIQTYIVSKTIPPLQENSNGQLILSKYPVDIGTCIIYSQNKLKTIHLNS